MLSPVIKLYIYPLFKNKHGLFSKCFGSIIYLKSRLSTDTCIYNIIARRDTITGPNTLIQVGETDKGGERLKYDRMPTFQFLCLLSNLQISIQSCQ